MKPALPMILAAAMLAAACTNGSDNPVARQENAPTSFSERLNQDQGYTRDKDGNWVPKSNKRSSFDRQGDSAYFKKNLQQKSFDTTTFDKKPWAGKAEVARPTFETHTNNRLSSQDAGINGLTALTPAGSTLPQQQYNTSTMPTETAREQAAKRIDKPSDAETDIRRRVYKQPDIIDYQQQRQLSVEQSKKILGR